MTETSLPTLHLGQSEFSLGVFITRTLNHFKRTMARTFFPDPRTRQENMIHLFFIA
jgi:hypothetical protein